ncbi:juvenile hormone acid O-methyltransferase-like [Phlebotomus argentipes]|uniref:juvenile hormone acid O-methyltransferase-like n=1 Tax=Phlebotomus argentipes TaxID=94469 RepID=UPI0028930670|nr:juvenile hormone acid O-methyltransferase-like [Phlebotomus argentipes]
MAFENAETYLKGSKCIINHTEDLLNEFNDWIQWRKDDKDSILDIGSGPGNSFHSTMFCRLPENFSRIVLSDISKPMVELQKKVFQGIDRVSCEILDIGSPIDENLSKKLGTFDHVTSFFCLMYVRDQERAMKNIYNLLKPGGDCFHVIVLDSPMLDAALSVCENPRWKDYFSGLQDNDMLPYIKLDKFSAKFKALKLMKSEGFINLKAKIRCKSIDFESDSEKENLLRSMPCKFCEEITPEEEEEIFQERLQFLDQFVLGQYRDNTGRIEKPNTYLILYGMKSK